jgi:NAD(P)-dependent dehydrogenase (short-subunit alcohol dehydrogenase family)
MILKDKLAVIYGAGGAIGGAVARAFAKEGAKVFLTGLQGERSKRSPRTLLPPVGPPRLRKSMLSTRKLSTTIYNP